MGCMIFPWESSDRHSRLSISPLLLLTLLLLLRPMVQQPVPHPCPCHATQGNCGLSGKIKTFASRTVYLSQKGRILKWMLWSQGLWGWAHHREGACVPRKEKIGLAPCAFSPPSLRAPVLRPSFPEAIDGEDGNLSAYSPDPQEKRGFLAIPGQL